MMKFQMDKLFVVIAGGVPHFYEKLSEQTQIKAIVEPSGALTVVNVGNYDTLFPSWTPVASYAVGQWLRWGYKATT